MRPPTEAAHPQREDQMTGFTEMLAKPAGAGAVAGSIAGIVASVVVAFVPAIVSYASFDRNIAIEAIKNAKNPADVKSVLELLCTRKFITDKDHCQTN
jgi:hypothetical protein